MSVKILEQASQKVKFMPEALVLVKNSDLMHVHDLIFPEQVYCFLYFSRTGSKKISLVGTSPFICLLLHPQG